MFQLKGPDIIADMKHYLSLLNLLYTFLKEAISSFFLESAGYTQEDVILREPQSWGMQIFFTLSL